MGKGADPFAVDCLLSCLNLWGVTEVTMKADMEPFTQALLLVVRRRRSQKTLIEVPLRHSHHSNSLVESAVRRLESLVRTDVAELEARLSVMMGASALILPWLVRHAAFVLTRFVVKADDRSSWARLRGREYTSAIGGNRRHRRLLGRAGGPAMRSSSACLVASSLPGRFVGERRKAGGRGRNTRFLASSGTRAACTWKHQWLAAEDVT